MHVFLSVTYLFDDADINLITDQGLFGIPLVLIGSHDFEEKVIFKD